MSGVDFGDGNRIGLEPLTERERQMVSKVLLIGLHLCQLRQHLMVLISVVIVS